MLEMIDDAPQKSRRVKFIDDSEIRRQTDRHALSNDKAVAGRHEGVGDVSDGQNPRRSRLSDRVEGMNAVHPQAGQHDVGAVEIFQDQFVRAGFVQKRIAFDGDLRQRFVLDIMNDRDHQSLRRRDGKTHADTGADLDMPRVAVDDLGRHQWKLHRCQGHRPKEKVVGGDAHAHAPGVRLAHLRQLGQVGPTFQIRVSPLPLGAVHQGSDQTLNPRQRYPIVMVFRLQEFILSNGNLGKD